jgi:hypothetical protein
MCDIPLGDRFEVVSNMSLEKTPFDTDNVGILFGKCIGPYNPRRVDWLYGAMAFPKKNQIEAREMVYKDDENAIKKVTLKGATKMRLVIWDGNVNVYVDGQPAFENRPMHGWDPQGRWRLGLGGDVWYTGVTMRFQNLMVRKLQNKPPDESKDH